MDLLLNIMAAAVWIGLAIAVCYLSEACKRTDPKEGTSEEEDAEIINSLDHPSITREIDWDEFLRNVGEYEEHEQ